MTNGGWETCLNDAQLFLAGVAAMVGVYHAAMGGWRRRGHAFALAATSILASGVLATNAAVIDSLHRSDLNAWVAARDVLISGLVLSSVPLISALVHVRPSRWWAAAVVLTVGTRLGLWLGTHLEYTYRSQHGLPRYGSLLLPMTLAVLVLLTGFLLHMALQVKGGAERTVLVAGVMGTVLLTLTSVVIPEGMAAELLTGYLTIPSLAALAVVVWHRQVSFQRLAVRVARRQERLARLSSLAVDAATSDVVAAAAQIVASELPSALAELGEPAPAGMSGGPGTSSVPAGPTSTAPSPTGGATALFADTPDVEDEDRQFVAAVRSVVASSARRNEALSELQRRAYLDEVTGLPNRARLRQVIAGVAASGRQVTVAVCNLARFTTVNELYGPALADEVLRAVGERLCRLLAPCHVGRMTGVDFAVVWDTAEAPVDADALAASVHRALRQPFHLPYADVRVSTRVGIATGRGPATDPDALLQDAVTALHDAAMREVATGSFRPELRQAASRRADLQRRLIGAVGRGEILVHYQPVVDLESLAVTGFEALARWRQDSTFVPTAEWIPIAELTGAIGEIGEHVLLTAAAQTRRWHTAGHPVELSVNASPRQLGDPTFTEIVAGATDIVPGGHLGLEITESLALNERARSTLDRIRAHGVRLSLDDFGTGYSALASIAQVPIDTVKIDKSIIDRIGQPDGRALVEATVAIARTLGLRVVAEGVERVDQHEVLRELGCSHAQGYLYSPPVDAEAAGRLLVAGLYRPEG